MSDCLHCDIGELIAEHIKDARSRWIWLSWRR